MKVCQPDITLLDKDGDVIAAIEIVVTHKPKENTLLYYEKNGITLIQINLESEDDLLKVEERISNPDIVNFCLIPECSNFKNHVVGRILNVKKVRCADYRYPKLSCIVAANCVFGPITTTLFTLNEIEEAKTKGVYFKILKNETTNREFSVVGCKNCELIQDKERRINEIRMSKYRRRPL